MKKTILLLLFCGLLAAHADFVYRSGTSFLTTGDLDGDGRSDLVLVDGLNATVRVGYQLSATNLTWAAARPLGLAEVTDINCGSVKSNAYDSIIATAPTLNRLNMYNAGSANTILSPEAIYMNGTGPYSLATLDIGGAGNTAQDDIVVITTLNGSSPHKMEYIRSQGTSFSTLGKVGIGSAWWHLNAIDYELGIEGLAVVDALSPGFLRIYDFSSGSYSNKASVSTFGLTQPHYVSFLLPSGEAHFVLWEKGSSTIRTTTLKNAGAIYSFSSLSDYVLPDPVDSIFLVQGDGTNRLAVVYSGGSSVGIFDHDGSGAPISLQTLVTLPGERFAGFLPLDTDNFMALSSGSGDLSGSITADQHHFAGGLFSSVGTVALPAPPPGGGAANVMTFVGEPLVDSAPQRLQLLRAGDWSTAVTLGVGVQATYETDRGWEQGLGDPTVGDLGSPATNAAYTLDNQFHRAISIHSFDAARGEEVAVIQISPDPGTYGTSVEVSLSATPASTLYYRLDASSGWSTYAAPFTIFADVDVQYYALSGAKNSIIRSAAYRFSDAPSDLDSDGDGIPDYVELANGLDPAESGLDSDGDGYSDLDELLAGSSPTNVAAIPLSSNRVERAAVYDQVLTPRAYDGIADTTKNSAIGTQVRLFSASGAQVGYAETTNLTIAVASTNPAAIFEAVALSLEPPFTTALTETRFDVDGTFSGNQYGIELLGIYLQPDPDAISVDYAYQGGVLATEASAWLAAAQDVYTNQVRTVQVADLSLTNTVAAMLVERKLANLLLDRGTLTNGWVSLFKGRPGDAAMQGLSSSDIQSLENIGSGSEPAYLVPSLVLSIFQEVPALAELLELTQDIYDLRSDYGSVSNNVGKYPLPVDVLRSFLYTGDVHSNYLAHASISPAEVSLAYAEATQTLAQVTARPVGSFTLLVRSNSFAYACPVLYTLGGTAKSLYVDSGNAFRFPLTFTLQPGAEVSVDAFTDPVWNLCPGTDPLEVISLALTAVPTATGIDADGNLLPDAYEEMFLVGSGGLATSDLDGDGWSDLQEYLDETDPDDATLHGVVIADLSPPVISLDSSDLLIDWPEAYAADFIFTVEYTEALNSDPFVADQELPIGDLGVTLDLAAGKSFYRVMIRLR
jgi:hypothetical protein